MRGRDGLYVVISRDPLPRSVASQQITGKKKTDPDWRWHVTVGNDTRRATWEEARDAAHELRPGITFALLIPPIGWWTNVDSRAIHLWEVKDDNLEDWLRQEGIEMNKLKQAEKDNDKVAPR